MAPKHERAEAAFLQALRGEIPPMSLPRGPERLTPRFASSPNWTLLSRVADYIVGDRYSASASLEHRLKGELVGPLCFQLHEPHSRNYSRMHYAGYRALWHHASRNRWHGELANAALIWLHHWHFIRAAATLPWGPPARRKGESRTWGRITDFMPGQRTKSKFWSESSVECITGQTAGVGTSNKQRLKRSAVTWHWRATEPLGIGNELSPKQRGELKAFIEEGKVPESFSQQVFDVPLRVNLHIIRTEEGGIAWMDRKIADKPACLVIRSVKGGDPEYGEGKTATLKGSEVVLEGDGEETTRTFDVPPGRTLFEIHQDSSGLSVRSGRGRSC